MLYLAPRIAPAAAIGHGATTFAAGLVISSSAKVLMCLTWR